MLKALATHKGQRYVGIVTVEGPPERERVVFATEIESVFREAGWTTYLNLELPNFRSIGELWPEMSGVGLVTHNQTNAPDLTPLMEAMQAAAIQHRVVNVGVVDHLYQKGVTTSMAVVFVGRKDRP